MCISLFFVFWVIHYRALNHSDTYVVLINFGARDEQIDINNVANNLPEEVEIAAAGSDSCYKLR